MIFQLNRDQKVTDHTGKYIEEKCLTDVTQCQHVCYGDRKYNLRQIILHTGEETLQGHYTAYDVEEMKVYDDSPPSFTAATDKMMTNAMQKGYLYLYQIDSNVDRYE